MPLLLGLGDLLVEHLLDPELHLPVLSELGGVCRARPSMAVGVAGSRTTNVATATHHPPGAMLRSVPINFARNQMRREAILNTKKTNCREKTTAVRAPTRAP